MTQPPSFGDLLRRYRLVAGLTQEDLAERAGLSARAISDLERGARRAPHRETVHLLAGALGLGAADRELLGTAARHPRRADVLQEHAREAAASVAGVVPKLVGRTRELEASQAKLDAALAGRGGLMLLAGEPGIGKTRLVEELANEASRRGVQVLWGRCWESDGAPPFWPWLEILRGVLRGQNAPEQPAVLGPRAVLIRELVPELQDQLSDLSPAPLLEAEEARFRLFDAITAILTAAAGASASGGLVLALDDLHWADKSSLLLLQFLLQRLGAARLLIVGTYRDTEVERHHPLAEVIPALRRERGFEQITLAGLSQADIGDLVESFLDQPLAANESSLGGLARTLWQEAEGNPFFVQEELRYLIENERLVRREGRWQSDASNVAALGLPEAVREVVGRRVSRLSAVSSDLLTLAAVVGREFEAATLERLSGVNKAALDDALDEAEAARIIEPLPRGPGYYRFSHALVREALYAALPARRRTRLHRQVGESLELQHAGDLESRLAELAYHFVAGSDGADIQKAIGYARRSGERALAVHAYEEAVRHFEAALRVLGEAHTTDAALRCDLLLALGEALIPAGEPLQAVEAIASEALALAERLGDGDRASRACQLALRGLRQHGGAAMGLRPESQRWLEAADRYALPGSLDRVRTDAALAWQEYFGNRQRAGYELARQALALARLLHHDEAMYQAASVILHMRLPEYQEARLQLAQELIQRGQGKASTNAFGDFLHFSCLVFLAWGERARAEEALHLLRELAERTGDGYLMMSSLGHDLRLMVIDGQLEEAGQAAEQFRRQAEELRVPASGQTLALTPLLRSRCYTGLAEEGLAAFPEHARVAVAEGRSLLYAADSALYRAHLGRWEEARELLGRLRERLRAAGDSAEISYAVLTNYLEAAVLAEDRELAAEIVPRLAGVSGLIAEVYPTCIARHLGAASALLGDFETARRYYEQALEVAAKIRFRPEIALTHLQLAELLLGEGVLRQAQDERRGRVSGVGPDLTPGPSPTRRGENDVGARLIAPVPSDAQRTEALAHLDFAVAEFGAMKMQPALERALRHQQLLQA